MKANHPLILGAMRRTRRSFIITTALALPTGGFMVAAPAWSNEARNITIACAVIGAIFLVFGAYLAWMTARLWRPESSPLMRVLRERPGDIAWIYEQQVNSRAGGVTVARAYNIQIRLVDGKGHNLSVKGADRDEVMRLLGEIAPAATFGYSRELAKQFRRDPRSLVAAAR